MKSGVALPLCVAVLAGVASPAGACGPMATVRFVEGAPTDRFEIVNNSSDGWDVARLALALDGSAGALIFDTRGGGPGSSMWQPFMPAPADFDAAVPVEVGDGTRALTLEFAGFRPGAAFRFTIDVDDTLVRSELGPMRVTESEIEGALAKAVFRAPDGEEMALDGHFGPDGIAIVSGLACS